MKGMPNCTVRSKPGVTGRRRSAFRGMLFLTAGLSLLALLLWGNATVHAQEAISQDRPTPAAVDEVITPMERSFEKAPPKEAPDKELHPFFRDQTLKLNLRTYYKYNDKFDDSVSEAWAIGGSLSYKTGYLFDHLAFGAAVYTSQPLYAPMITMGPSS